MAKQEGASGTVELAVKDFYRKVWQEYADPHHHPITAAALRVQSRFVSEWIGANRPESVLDLGCGPASVIPDAGTHLLVCADLVQEMLLRVKNDKGCPALCLDARQLPFRDTCFDLVWCGLLVDHIEEVRPWILEVIRILKPGGTLGLACWDRSHLPRDRYPQDRKMRYSTSHGEELSVASHPTWAKALEILAALDPALDLKSFSIIPEEYVLQIASARIVSSISAEQPCDK